MLGHSSRRRQAGDTIVEVMVVLAIVGLALGVAFATANRSLKRVHQAQEHAQALQLLQGQLEQLKAGLLDATTGPYITAHAASGFCFTGNGSGPALDTTTSCKQQLNLYSISITCKFVGATCNDTYTATASWPSISGNGNDQESLIYKVYGL